MLSMRQPASMVQHIDGNMVSDILVSVLLCPFAVVQLHDEAAAALEDGASNVSVRPSVADSAQADLHRTMDVRGSPDAPKPDSTPQPQPQPPPQQAQQMLWHAQPGQYVQYAQQAPHVQYAQHAQHAQHAQLAENVYIQQVPPQQAVQAWGVAAAAPSPSPQDRAGLRGLVQPVELVAQPPTYGHFHHSSQGPAR